MESGRPSRLFEGSYVQSAMKIILEGAYRTPVRSHRPFFQFYMNIWLSLFVHRPKLWVNLHAPQSLLRRMRLPQVARGITPYILQVLYVRTVRCASLDTSYERCVCRRTRRNLPNIATQMSHLPPAPTGSSRDPRTTATPSPHSSSRSDQDLGGRRCRRPSCGARTRCRRTRGTN